MEMNKFILLSLTLVLVLGLVESFEFSERELQSDSGLQSMYARWQAHHNLEAPPPGDKNKRFNAFKANAKLVHSTNKMNKSYKLGMTKFADLSSEEFTSIYASSKLSEDMKASASKMQKVSTTQHENLPEALDWRTQNAVTPVKDQGQCGSCWTFGVLGGVEGAYAIKTGQLVALSEQELVDCDTKNNGCKGGITSWAIDWIKENDGITTLDAYPYVAKKQPCQRPKGTGKVVKVDGWTGAGSFDESLVMAAIQQQPLTCIIDCSNDWHLYKGGLYDGECKNASNSMHAVTNVGYDTAEDGTKYWIIKNSWGKAWGEDGYLRLIRGIADTSGKCGINNWCCTIQINDHVLESQKQEL